jgi:hypothetical protein
MKKQILLKKFEYSIPLSALVKAGLRKNHFVAERHPLMKVTIDFENGNLTLQGDWQFMMAYNKHSEKSWYSYHKERVKIETAIYPASVINLSDPNSDGLMFPLEGKIKDGNYLSACSGLLIVDNIRGIKGFASDRWNISCYIYDLQFDNCEIKFKLPVYTRIINS